MFVHWQVGPKLDGKFHIVQRTGFTLCGRRIRKEAVFSKKTPREKATICKWCGEIDEEREKYKNLFK
jgi:hypothetical protein